jgi:hypothetical protein
MVLYLCVLIMFLLHRESLKLILVDELLEMVMSQGGSNRKAYFSRKVNHHTVARCAYKAEHR